MSRIRVEITTRHVKEALAAVGREEMEIADTREPGLSIRVRAKSAAWYLRGRYENPHKVDSWRIDDVRSGDDPDRIRDVVRGAKLGSIGKPGSKQSHAMVGIGEYFAAPDRAGWRGQPMTRAQYDAALDEYWNGFNSFFREKNEAEADLAKNPWSFPNAVAAFIKHKKATKRLATYNDYRKTLNSASLNELRSMTVDKIDPFTVRRLVNVSHSAGHTAQANLTLRTLKSFMSWATQMSGSPIENMPSPLIGVKPIAMPERRRAPPSVDSLGKVFWRLDQSTSDVRIKLAAAFVMLIGQRVTMTCSATINEFHADADGAAWRLEGARTKNRQPHGVPLSKLGWAVVQRAKLLSGNSPYLFPQVRPQKAGGKGDGFLSSKSVYEALRNAGGGELTPHKARSAMSSHGVSKLKVDDSVWSLIMHHGEAGRTVHGRHYAHHESLPKKMIGIKAWEDFLVSEMKRHAPAGQSWPGFLPRIE